MPSSEGGSRWRSRTSFLRLLPVGFHVLHEGPDVAVQADQVERVARAQPPHGVGAPGRSPG